MASVAVVGSATGGAVQADMPIHQLTDLGDLPGNTLDFSRPYAMNNSGQVVGHSTAVTGDRAFPYSAGVMSDLNSPIDPSSPLALHVLLADAVAINESGAIAAFGLDVRTGTAHAYLLTTAAVPLPAGTWLLLSGLTGLGGLRRRTLRSSIHG